MAEETNSSDHTSASTSSQMYRQLQERNARQRRAREEKMQRLVELNAHRGPQPFRHPSR
jgi:hypothetical protein